LSPGPARTPCVGPSFFDQIRSRTSEGRERAKAKGVVMGRKPKLTPHQRREAIARRDAGEALVDIARSYNVSHSTISRLCCEQVAA
jgi:DNA invertase Pin-like site-specific DNA recombinase